jgi:RND family efflux transporter MFP subunit
MKRYLWLVIVIAVTILFLGQRQVLPWVASLSGWFSMSQAMPVQVVQVKRGGIDALVRESAELESGQDVDVSSVMPGVVTEVRFKVGDRVQAGQVVATIRATGLRQGVEQTEANLKAAEASLKEKEDRLSDALKQLERARDYRARDLISGRDVNLAETAAETAKAQRDLARAQLEQQKAASAQLRYLSAGSKVVAPSGGLVTQRWVEPGGSTLSAAPILTLSELDPLKVTINVAPADLPAIRKGMVAEVTAEKLPGRIFNGQVVDIDAAAAATGQSPAVDIQLPNRDGLLTPGMMVAVALPLEAKKTALLVPKAALVEADGKSFVYVVEDQLARRVVVTTGWNKDEKIEIINGVREGEWVVIDGQKNLKPSQKVRPVVSDTRP